ncbi:hypothetical protein Dimus_022740, partial [Dionaea muscipula]
MHGKNQTKEPVKYCKPGSIDHYLRLKKRKHVNDDLLDIHVPHVDEQHQESEIAEVEDNVNLLPDDWEDLVLEEEDLNLEEDRHEESLPCTETGKEENPERERQKANANKEPPTTVDMFTETRKRVATREYKESFEDTQRKIAEMEQLQAQKGENCNISDPFSAVMPKEHTGHVRLVGKGVTKSDLKASSSSTSTVIDGITILFFFGLAARIQSPGDAVNGQGTRNASSSVPTHTPSFNQ